MARLPPEPEQRALLESILGGAKLRPAAEIVLGYLFERSIQSVVQGKPQEKITAREIWEACFKGRASQQHVVENILSELRAALNQFFPDKQSERANELIRVEIERHTHVLRFERNRQLCEAILNFWNPYLSSFYPAVLCYPEPQFFRHRSGAYVRHARANWRDEKSVISERLKINASDLIPSYSFVASGITTAVARLFECFQQNEADLHARGLKTTDETMPAGWQHLIVLGTPTTNLPLIRSLEFPGPMRTDRKEGRTVFSAHDPDTGKPALYTDQVEEEINFDEDLVPLEKFAIVTRHVRPREESAQGESTRTGVLTLVAGHSRSVQGVVQMLTMEQSTRQIMQRFGNTLPRQFQALFRVRMLKNAGDLRIEGVDVVSTASLDEKGSPD